MQLNLILILLKHLKIGIAWKGSSGYAADRERSFQLECFKPILDIDDVRIVTLMQNSRAEFLEFAGNRALDIGHEIDEATAPFEETAALIMNLDLVITCDTSVGHLAGALGKSAWVLLPYSPDWRWIIGRDNSPWYPHTRLFKQFEPGNWTEVFERVTSAIRDQQVRIKWAINDTY